jgi:hypothetical protein
MRKNTEETDGKSQRMFDTTVQYNKHEAMRQTELSSSARNILTPATVAMTPHTTLLSRRMASSGMLRRVALVRTDVSEESSAYIIRMTRIGELQQR